MMTRIRWPTKLRWFCMFHHWSSHSLKIIIRMTCFVDRNVFKSDDRVQEFKSLFKWMKCDFFAYNFTLRKPFLGVRTDNLFFFYLLGFVGAATASGYAFNGKPWIDYMLLHISFISRKCLCKWHEWKQWFGDLKFKFLV